MNKRTLAVVAVFAVLATACSRLYVQAPVGGASFAEGQAVSTVFLIGDFGKDGPPLVDLIDAIADDVAQAPATARTPPLILELGDNLYDNGLPHDLDLPGAAAEVEKLRAVARAFAEVRHRGRQVPLVLVPGNHDYNDEALVNKDNLGDISRWYFLDELGIEGAGSWTQVPGSAAGFGSAAELYAHLDGDAQAHVEFMAPRAVPGTDADLGIIGIDSELVLDLYAGDLGELATSYWTRLDAVLAAVPEDDWLMIATHHPPVTYGKHGRPSFGNWVFGQGWPQFPSGWQKALAFAGPLGIVLGIAVHPAAVAVAAAPPVSTAFVSGRKQDVGSDPYDRYAAELLRLAAAHDVDAILAGHDHNTQIIELGSVDGVEGDTLMVVSGAGSKVDPVRRGPGTVAYLADYSYVRMTQYAGGLSFEIVDRRGNERFRYELAR